MTSTLAAAIEVVAAGPFWSSDTFWAAAGVIVGAGVGAAGVYATVRASVPKRRLMYSFSSVSIAHVFSPEPPDLPPFVWTALLRSSLEGSVLGNPRLVSLRLENTGRRDISSDQFDQGEPLHVVLGTPVVGLLMAAAEPPGAFLRSGDFDGQGMTIPPGRLGAGEAITYTFLVDGDPDSYRLTHALIDVEVKEKFPPRQVPYMFRR
ncbi:hypothetical protein [Streptomyces sp. NBC_00140]|uniref:hypothetical protein n=1 Tax=Streptomyces sp. NBC_00140 TaxID=2975664 RepID=UPI00224D41BF|nr:hypothetical protein [Streptomyces sp. NBC_00140]MCX5328118.1 hypothetical protein [Streptomyces sp. NBC_00140]